MEGRVPKTFYRPTGKGPEALHPSGLGWRGSSTSSSRKGVDDHKVPPSLWTGGSTRVTVTHGSLRCPDNLSCTTKEDNHPLIKNVNHQVRDLKIKEEPKGIQTESFRGTKPE